MVLRKGTGKFSKLLEASEERRRVMEWETWRRDLQVIETLASSGGVSHGRTSSAHSMGKQSLGLCAFLRTCCAIGVCLERFLLKNVIYSMEIVRKSVLVLQYFALGYRCLLVRCP